MSGYSLNERERAVLAVLIDHYIRTAEPVGSRTIATRYKLGVSPATVRNTLADLEERGFITQPHTSAGRIPTDSGYRLYIEKLLKSEKLKAADREMIRRELSTDFSAIEDILEQTSRVLANISSQLGVTVGPKFEQGVLSRIEVMPVSDTKLLVVLMVKSGVVKTVLVEIDRLEHGSDLSETVALLNEKLCGLSLKEIKATIAERLRDTGRGDPQVLKLFMENHEAVLDDSRDSAFFTDGTINIVQKKEFQDPRKLREFLTLLEERKSLVALLNREPQSSGIMVTFGDESEIEGISGCAVVASSFQAGRLSGKVGIIGPTRMQYAKLMPVVEYTAKILTEILSK
jgi:heat-inducible transcriptional repressor